MILSCVFYYKINAYIYSMKNKDYDIDSDCINYTTESCATICPGCENKKRKRKTIDDIFRDKDNKDWKVLKGQIPTQLGEYFIWLRKPEKGVHIVTEIHHFREQKIDTTGMYPINLIRTEKNIAKVIPLSAIQSTAD